MGSRGRRGVPGPAGPGRVLQPCSHWAPGSSAQEAACGPVWKAAAAPAAPTAARTPPEPPPRTSVSKQAHQDRRPSQRASGAILGHDCCHPKQSRGSTCPAQHLHSPTEPPPNLAFPRAPTPSATTGPGEKALLSPRQAHPLPQRRKRRREATPSRTSVSVCLKVTAHFHWLPISRNFLFLPEV